MKENTIRNIVIVHGAFADASGWEPVYHLLRAKGHHVTLVQNATATLNGDVAATVAALDRQVGPVIPVGHSWGGTVITAAGTHEKVQRFVYATFATGQPAAKSAFMYDVQIPLTVTAFTDKVSQAAWKEKKSYALLPTDDGTVNPALEQKMYHRAGCLVREVTGGHTFFMNSPELVVDVTMEAAGR